MAPAPAAASPPLAKLRPPPRDLRLDIVRGWLQLSIFVSHVVGTELAWGIHAAWGVSDSSEPFVFLSGFVLGSVFTLKAARDGADAARADLLGRTLHLYRTHLAVLAAFALLVLAAQTYLPLPGEVDRLGWTWLVEAPLLAVPAAASLHWQPAFTGILPVFIWSMLLLPPFMWLVERFGVLALVPPLLAWGAVQAGWVATPGFGDTGIAFDPLAWQLLFLLGAWLGRRALLVGEAVPWNTTFLAAALAVVIAGVWVRLVTHGFLSGPKDAELALIGKEMLAPARLVHVLALAYIVASLVPRQAGWMKSAPLSLLGAIGRYSLQVFCVGLFLAWVASIVLSRLAHAAPWIDPLLILGGAAVLAGVALAQDSRRARRGSPGPQPGAPCHLRCSAARREEPRGGTCDL